ncbi:hypothetical protein AUJ73_05000 [Candidatus Gottesmanbacteria bacterium CG1_02_37_22]|uniref:Uncharacterized protein n=1 Tax=Candidatus Gottesmanbacteria bacterium CG1_02_37_22 TaxID=1805209 RepID=A0A1J4TLV7_9BACT|nr:MAG: hypothetical protein AUJ73_05000 [Candidatus Gottesmanbacteria bacterium CG1_02_37_22]
MAGSPETTIGYLHPAVKQALQANPGILETVSSDTSDEPAEINWSHIPLGRLEMAPVEHDPDGFQTALHEATHFLAARVEGVRVKRVTIVPNPQAGYKGCTELGYAPPDKFQVIAAASRINLKGYTPRGFGGDMASIAMVDWKKGRNPGSSIPFSIMSAQNSLLSAYSPDMISKVAHIIFTLKDVSESKLNEVVERARWELHLGKDPFKLIPKDEKGSTRIEYYDTFALVTSKPPDGHSEKKFIICLHCGEISGHSQNCIFAKSMTQELPQSTIYIDSAKQIDPKDITPSQDKPIFEASRRAGSLQIHDEEGRLKEKGVIFYYTPVN